MKFQLPINIPPLPRPIGYTDKVLLIGSCFTEHISGRLAGHKFKTLQNPHGILFNPLSVADSLLSYAQEKLYAESDLFFLNELWGSWAHHTRFSHIDKRAALEGINASQHEASNFVKEADWLIVTLGSAFQYFLKANIPEAQLRARHSAGTGEMLPGASQADRQQGSAPELQPTGDEGFPVANNHRAPAAWFEKRLLEIPVIVNALQKALAAIKAVNPEVRFLFTISPVRHIRDGVVDNNRSKARLIEAVHRICEDVPDCFYFPAYELVIDVLRDYRFYDIDMVHPNYAATESVWEAFVQACIAPAAWPAMEQVKEIVTAKNHRPRFPETAAHQQFLKNYARKVADLAAAHPYLDLSDEATYFVSATGE